MLVFTGVHRNYVVWSPPQPRNRTVPRPYLQLKMELFWANWFSRMYTRLRCLRMLTDCHKSLFTRGRVWNTLEDKVFVFNRNLPFISWQARFNFFNITRWFWNKLNYYDKGDSLKYVSSRLLFNFVVFIWSLLVKYFQNVCILL